MPEPQEPAFKPMTDDERRRRYEELRRRSSLSRIYARHRNPDMYVKWARDDRYDRALHKHLGFEIVHEDPKKPEARRLIDTVVPISDDGFYRTGDVILVQIPRIDYEFYCQMNVEESRRMVNAGKEGFKSDAAKLGIPVFERDKAGHIIHS